MPLNSVQLHVRSLLDGLPIPGSSQHLDAYITPPVLDELDNPKAYIWGGRARLGRQTMPRGVAPAAGFKKAAWRIDIYLSYETVPENPNMPAGLQPSPVDMEFPVIADAIFAALGAATMPTMITDPVTGVVSQLLAIGEEMDWEYPPERVPATLRMLYYTGKITTVVQEAVQS